MAAAVSRRRCDAYHGVDTHMEPAKKTTILFPPDLYNQMARLAKRRQISVGELVREACKNQLGLHDSATRLEAVRELARLNLPVGSPAEMKIESVPSVKALS